MVKASNTVNSDKLILISRKGLFLNAVNAIEAKSAKRTKRLGYLLQFFWHQFSLKLL